MPRPSPLPLPDIDDLTDCDTDVSDSEDSNDESITQPTRAFFLGVRTSTLVSPRDLEVGRVPRNISSDTLVSDRPDNQKEKSDKPDSQGLLSEDELNDPFTSNSLDNSPLPRKRGPRVFRHLRWNFGSVYRRIFCLAFLANLAALAFLIAHWIVAGNTLTYQQASTAVTANILAAIAVRNEHVVNSLFWVFGTWPTRLPLRARRLVAKIYSYGGIHSGGAVAGTVWYLAFLVLLTMDFRSNGETTVLRSYIYFVSYTIIVLLVTMLITAYPHLRRIMHNWFEGVHRFMGWSAVLLFWAQLMLVTAEAAQHSDMGMGKALLVSSNFWMLATTTLLVIYPWARLRLREVEAEVLSEHCVKLNFNYRNVHYGQAIRITDAPLKETHAFGVIPYPAAPKPTGANIRGANMKGHVSQLSLVRSPDTTKSLSHAGDHGFSVIVSNAGDWTRKIIQNPPTKIYTRGTPQFGVMRIAGLFEPCIIVATGSGIAPCMSLFVQKPDHPVRIVWSTKAPLSTYGAAVIDLIYKTDPRAIIIDTSRGGPATRRPDLVKIVYRVWEQSQRDTPADYAGLQGRQNTSGRSKPVGKCEAVVVISNQRLTRKVVYGLETRGVPAYGAIFDS
ncbi:hypothetical protein B0T26DRAFT_645128 [Lasiosphaeria miniovina]|uniref:Uncharacterized protein n=1 Tax=Lasiosphaeria miniovina TaxID=1954250 RepID=A0AA40DUF8_9PEZI|nr:uncharacterized protein B0T26DRAFT_645128 [Lasiosphaeria miniovina]KAK0716779.1 hypothetical protein B0T26DRAFT_645128 [Lasiosphaeria miniovina]